MKFLCTSHIDGSTALCYNKVETLYYKRKW